MISSLEFDNEKYSEVISQDFQTLTDLSTNQIKTDTNLTSFIIYTQKIFLIDVDNLKYFYENQHEFFNVIQKKLLLINIGRRVERHVNKKIDRPEGHIDNLKLFFEAEKLKDLVQFNKMVEGEVETSKLKEYIDKIKNLATKNSKCAEYVSLIDKLMK